LEAYIIIQDNRTYEKPDRTISANRKLPRH